MNNVYQFGNQNQHHIELTLLAIKVTKNTMVLKNSLPMKFKPRFVSLIILNYFKYSQIIWSC